MKKFLLVSVIVLFLAACGESKGASTVHENISEDMANDTEQILNTMDTAIEENRALSDHELSVFDHYLAEYNGKKDVGNLTGEEEVLLITTSKIVENPEIYMTLESDKENYKTLKTQIQNIIKTGEF